MLRGIAARGRAIGDAAQHRAIAKAAVQLQAAFPNLSVSVDGGAIMLTGRLSREDARLRWIGGLL